MNEKESASERVYCVNDSWDNRPILGIADYKNDPYAFECIFDDSEDDWTDYYVLTPIKHDVFKLVIENWNYWLDWINRNNKIPHPKLYNELRNTKSMNEIMNEFDSSIDIKDWNAAEKYLINETLIKPYLIPNEKSVKAKGEFIWVNDGSWGNEDRMPKFVIWVLNFGE